MAGAPRLKPEQIEKLKKLSAEGKTIKALAAMFGRCEATIKRYLER